MIHFHRADLNFGHALELVLQNSDSPQAPFVHNQKITPSLSVADNLEIEQLLNGEGVVLSFLQPLSQTSCNVETSGLSAQRHVQLLILTASRMGWFVLVYQKVEWTPVR